MYVLLLQLRYFDDPICRCMQLIENIDSQDLQSRADFYEMLAAQLVHIPKVSFNIIVRLLCGLLKYLILMNNICLYALIK